MKKVLVEVSWNRFIQAYKDKCQVEEIGSGIRADVVEVNATFYLQEVGSNSLIPIREFTDTDFVIVNE